MLVKEVNPISYKSTSYKSKWVKTKWLVKEPAVEPYVPKTLLFTQDNVTTIFESFQTIYFKPTNGSGGSRIVKISLSDDKYTTIHRSETRSFSNLDSLYVWMKKFAGTRPFLLQQGIELAKSNGNPFDIRVMVQRTKENKWVTSAIFTKVGLPGKVTTNYHQGGKVQFINKTLSGAGLDKEASDLAKAELRKLGLLVANTFDQHTKGCKELGLDVALDTEGKLWILEVNTRPQFFPLKNMKNKNLYNKILSYAKDYGRKR